MPTRAIHHEDGVRAGRDAARDFIDMRLHGVGVDPWRGDSRALAERRTDRAEGIGVFVTLIGGLARTRALARPLANDAVLLADAGFVLEPQFDRRVLGYVFQMNAQRVREVFLKASMISGFCAG